MIMSNNDSKTIKIEMITKFCLFMNDKKQISREEMR